MVEQHLDGNLRIFGGKHTERLDVGRNRRVERDELLVNKSHHSDGSHHLAYRTDAVHRISRGRGLCFFVRMTEGFHPDQFFSFDECQ